MRFVYLSIVSFAVWMILIEGSPWPTLTLIVSFGAIFLSTFVMISQNRADEKRQVLATQEWQSVQLEEQQNEQLLDLSRQMLGLTNAIHRLTIEDVGGSAWQSAQERRRPRHLDQARGRRTGCGGGPRSKLCRRLRRSRAGLAGRSFLRSSYNPAHVVPAAPAGSKSG